MAGCLGLKSCPTSSPSSSAGTSPNRPEQPSPTPTPTPTPSGSAVHSPATVPAPKVPAGPAGGGGALDWLTPALVGTTLVLLLVAIVLLVLWLGARRRAEMLERAARAPRGGTDGTGLPGGPEDLGGILMRLADAAEQPATAAQAERALALLGIVPIPVHAGDSFDDRVHQVAATRPSPDRDHDDRVATEVRRGWRRGPEVLRPADVSLWVAASR